MVAALEEEVAVLAEVAVVAVAEAADAGENQDGISDRWGLAG